jgi:aminoglycoside phosphotransferase (APT) family kinase protein
MPEQQRNRLLRRVDWRFLLPEARVRRAACFGDAELARGVALISDEVSSRHAIQPGSCDLVVVVDPDVEALRDAWRALRPGGMLYGEWYRPSFGTPAKLGAQLRAIGYARVASYFAWPAPRRASSSFWIPLDVAGPRTYFLNTRPRRSGVGRVGALSMRAAWRLLLQLGAIRPICLVAERPAGPASVGYGCVPEIGWSEDVLGPIPERIAWLLLTGGRASTNKVAAFGFADAESQPRLVVKMARVPESGHSLEREAAALRAIHASRAEGVEGAPRALSFSASRGTSGLGETVIDGEPLYRSLSATSFEALAQRGTRWLATLAAGVPASPVDEWRKRLVDGPFAVFERQFGSVMEPATIAAIRARLARLPDLPIVPEHRDFSPWNVVMTPGRGLGVLDWESAEPAGLPLMDLVYFLTYLAIFREGGSEPGRDRSAYARSLDPATETGRVVQSCIATYVEETGIPLATVDALRVLTWVVHTQSDYRAMVAERGRNPDPSTLAQSSFLGFLEETLART